MKKFLVWVGVIFAFLSMIVAINLLLLLLPAWKAYIVYGILTFLTVLLVYLNFGVKHRD